MNPRSAIPSTYTDPQPTPVPVPRADLPIEPLRDLVILQHLPPNSVIGRFVVPEEHQERPTVAVVLARGDGRHSESGEWVPVDPKIVVGAHVLVPDYVGSEFEVAGQKYTICRSDELMGVLKEPVN